MTRSASPALRALPQSPETTRVNDIRKIPNEAHMLRCVQAIRNREPPLWSWSGFTVSPARLRRIR